MQAAIADAAYKVLASDNLIYGPVDGPTLVQWVRERRVQPESWVFVEAANDWVAAGTLELLKPEFQSLPTLTATPQTADSLAVKVTDLRKFERFAFYTDDEIAFLISLCDTVVAAKGELIIKKGEMSNCLFLMISGEARARIKVGNQDTSLGKMVSGELFGEVAMLSQTARSADVVAEVPTRLLRLSSDRLQELLSSNSPLAAKMFYNISRLLATRLSQRTVELQQDVSASFLWR